MKLGMLKKNKSETLDNLSKQSSLVLEIFPWAFTQTHSIGLENEKFAEIKPVPDVKHVKIGRFYSPK